MQAEKVIVRAQRAWQISKAVAGKESNCRQVQQLQAGKAVVSRESSSQ